MEDIEELKELIHMAFPGDDFDGHRERIQEAMKAAIVKRQYEEARPFYEGYTQELKRSLAEIHDISLSTVDKYISRI